MDPDAIDSLFSTSGRERVEEYASGKGAGQVDRTSALRVAHGNASDPWLLDFSSCTNPSIPQGAVQIYQTAFAASRSYPSDSYCDFRVAAAEYIGCEPKQVIPTPGSLAAIRLAVATTIDSDDDVLIPVPSIGEYEREVCLQGGNPTFRHYTELLEADPAEYDLVIANTPNNPVGAAYDPGRLSAFADRCQRAGTPLLVDESFLDFTELPSLAGRDGVIVARSLTKVFGFPGLRAGFAVATGKYRDRLDVTRLTWWVGKPAADLGVYCMDDEAFVEESRSRVRSERERMRDHLESQFDIPPSDAPFLLLDAGTDSRVESVIDQARAEGIAVRDARTFRGLDSHVRVAVRLPDENDRLLAALDGV